MSSRVIRDMRHELSTVARRQAELQLTRDAKAKFARVVGEQTFKECALAHTGWARDDEGPKEVRRRRHEGGGQSEDGTGKA